MPVNLSGIDAGTILSYPKPQPVPSAAYEKAKAILARVPSDETEKTAWQSPSRVDPGYNDAFGEKKKNPHGLKSLGGHVLGGAGAGKLVHDWVDTGRQAHMKYPRPAGARSKFWGITAGALLGTSEFTRKRVMHALKERKEKAVKKTETKKKTAGVGNLGAEEAAQLKHKVLTRAATRAEADALFNHKATEIAANNQKYLKEHFVQAPAAETMAVSLAKTASVDAFFDSLYEPQLDTAQKRYPELLKVSAPTPLLKRPKSAPPVNPQMSGGSP